MQTESTVEDILRTVERFRVLCVGRAGVGKSSLINRVFRVQDAHVAHFKPGESDIYQEFTSEENPYFVLHDSKGFEPGDTVTFDIVRQFILERGNENLELKHRLHAVWLCTETPTAGGRVFEAGDKMLLQLAHQTQIPVVVVFTQYDRLVRTKKSELEDEDSSMDPNVLDQQSKDEAKKAFASCVQSLKLTMESLDTPMPHYVTVSIRQGYEDNVSTLVEVTRDLVQDRLKGDAWIMWAIAQRASLPVKIDACIAKGLSHYRRALTGGTPGVGHMLLRDCLVKVHQDIIACWNFKGGEVILNSDEFKHLMLYLIQDIQDQSGATTPPDIDKISHFVGLITAASAPVAPPIAILGLSYFFVKWLSSAVLDNISSVQSLLVAYTVDLISVLKSLFDFTLKPSLSGTTTWEVLKEAFEAYERSDSRHRIHDHVRSNFHRTERILELRGVHDTVSELLGEHSHGM